MPPLKAQLLLAESLAAYFPEMVFTDSGITVQIHRNTQDQALDPPKCFFTRSGSIFGCPDIEVINVPQVEVDKPLLCIGQLVAMGNCIGLKLLRKFEIISSSF